MNTSVLDTATDLVPLNVSGVGEVAPTEQPDELLPVGCCIAGKYTVHGLLGQGGFAVVYDAEHTGLGRRVAIKVLHVRADTPVGLIERFRREARISAVVHHRHVLEVYDTGALVDGSPFLVMERLSGENLAAHIARGPLPLAQVVELGRQLLMALVATGEAGIVHRDIKPENVMLHDPGEGPLSVKLVDFGISKRMRLEPEPKLTSHGALVGTPQYMSPEQIQGEEVDVRTDLYAVGAVLYEALTGHAPHERSNFSELLVAVLNAPVPPLSSRSDCPVELAQIIHIALARNRQDRYGSAREFLDALEHCAATANLLRGGAALTGSVASELEPESASRRTIATALGGARGRLGSRPLRLSLAATLLGVGATALHFHGAPWGGDSVLMPSAQATAADESQLHRRADPGAPQRPVSVDSLRFFPSEGEASTAQTLLGSQASSGAAADDALSFVSSVPMSLRPAVDDSDVATLEMTALAALPAAPRVPAAQVVGQKPMAPELPGTLVERTAASMSPVQASESAAPAKPDSAAVAAWLNARAHKLAIKAALAALVRGQLDEAHARYAEAVRLEPRDAVGFRGLGLVAARIGNHAEARQALERYLLLAPHARDAQAIAARIQALPAN